MITCRVELAPFWLRHLKRIVLLLSFECIQQPLFSEDVPNSAALSSVRLGFASEFINTSIGCKMVAQNYKIFASTEPFSTTWVAKWALYQFCLETEFYVIMASTSFLWYFIIVFIVPLLGIPFSVLRAQEPQYVVSGFGSGILLPFEAVTSLLASSRGLFKSAFFNYVYPTTTP